MKSETQIPNGMCGETCSGFVIRASFVLGYFPPSADRLSFVIEHYTAALLSGNLCFSQNPRRELRPNPINPHFVCCDSYNTDTINRAYFQEPILANGDVSESASPHSSGEFHVSTPGVSSVASSCGTVSVAIPIITPRPLDSNCALEIPR